MTNRRMALFVRGDLDGFLGLALDNLVQLLVINGLCAAVLGFGPELLYGRVLPGIAVSMLIGNLFYAWQAKRLADRTGRTDVCALPYGINTPSVFAYVLLVMLPAKLAAQNAGMTPEQAATIAWRAGLVACLGSGIIEFAGAFVAERVRRATPRAALLSTLAGIALPFISITFLFRSFTYPIVGLATFAVIMLAYFGRVRFRGGLPAGLIAVVIGAALCWATGVAGEIDRPARHVGLYLPVPVLGDLAAALSSRFFLTYLSVIIPMGLFNVIASMQNIESAEAEGDAYPTAPSLAVNGLGTIAAALFGSCFPTTIYIGHPGWKALGARAGYSVLNAVFITAICLTGAAPVIAWAVPVEAAMVIVLWIGIMIAAQAFSATPRHHAPAVVVGLLPGIAAWGALMIKTSLQVAGFGPDKPMTAALIEQFESKDVWLHGMLALDQGFIITAMILAAVTVLVIERRFFGAAAWCAAAALLTSVGLMHSYDWTATDTIIRVGWPWDVSTWPWIIGYLTMSALFVAARWLTVPTNQEPH